MSPQRSGSSAVAGAADRDSLRILFEPVALGGLQLPNRIVMAPMGTALDEGGFITDATIAYYVRRAQGGVGTITVEGCLVAPYSEGPEPRIDSRSYLPGLTRLVEALRPYDVIVGVQLMHPGRQVVAGRRVAPSPIPLGPGAPVPDVLSVEEIADVVGQYAAATDLAREAGFAFVEVHGAHGYLPSNFLSPATNVREDAYGGTLEHRARFCREVARAIVAVGGDAMPLVWRLNGDDGVPGGMGIDEAVQVAAWLEQDGVASISVSSGTWHALQATVAPMFVPRGHMIPLASAIKQVVRIPVIAVGRLDDPALAATVVRDGHADLICLGRGLIADPDWPARVRAGAVDEIRPCIACNICLDLVGRGEPARCAVNPEVGQELTWRLDPASHVRNVMVVGSGPAGMESARLARLRGHNVSIWERDGVLGGKFEVASLAPSKHEVRRARDHQIQSLERLGVTVHVGREVTAEIVRREAPDVVLIASGAEALRPRLPGVAGSNVVDAQLLLGGEVTVEPGERVVVVGGSATGCETAERMVELGARVTVIEMGAQVGMGIEGVTRRHLVRGLKKAGVTIRAGCRVVEIDADQVWFTCENEQGRQAVPADVVALAIGWTPRGSALSDVLDVGPQVIVVGDAANAGDFAAAVGSAAAAALVI